MVSLDDMNMRREDKRAAPSTLPRFLPTCLPAHTLRGPLPCFPCRLPTVLRATSPESQIISTHTHTVPAHQPLPTCVTNL
jgi:hypothetical protein